MEKKIRENIAATAVIITKNIQLLEGGAFPVGAHDDAKLCLQWLYGMRTNLEGKLDGKKKESSIRVAQ